MIKRVLFTAVIALPLNAFAQEEMPADPVVDMTEMVAAGIEDRVPCPDSLERFHRFSERLKKALKLVKDGNKSVRKASGEVVVDMDALREELVAYKLDCRDSLENPDDDDSDGDDEVPSPTPTPEPEHGGEGEHHD